MELVLAKAKELWLVFVEVTREKARTTWEGSAWLSCFPGLQHTDHPEVQGWLFNQLSGIQLAC